MEEVTEVTGGAAQIAEFLSMQRLCFEEEGVRANRRAAGAFTEEKMK